MWHAEPVVYVLRHYEQPDGWEKRVPYDTVLVVHIVGDGQAFVAAMHGEFDTQARRELRSTLRKLGVRRVKAVRHGQMKEFDE